MGTPSAVGEFVITLKGLIRNNIVSYIFENNFSHAHVYDIIRLICRHDENVYLKGGLVLQVALDKLIANSSRPASCEKEIEGHGALGDIDMGYKGEIEWRDMYDLFCEVRGGVASILSRIPYHRGVGAQINENIWHIILLKLYRGYHRNNYLRPVFGRAGLDPCMEVADIDSAIHHMKQMIRIDSVEYSWTEMEDKHCDVQKIMDDPSYGGEAIEHTRRRYAISAIEGINGNNGIFDLMRMGPVIKVEVDMDVSGMLVSFSSRFLLPFFDLSHNITISPEVVGVPITHTEEKGIRYQKVGNYLIADLKRMLYQEAKYPWLTGKYEKRLRRYIMYGVLYPIIDPPIDPIERRESMANVEGLYLALKTVVDPIRGSSTARGARLDDYHPIPMPNMGVYDTTRKVWRDVMDSEDSETRQAFNETMQAFREYISVVDSSLVSVRRILRQCFGLDIRPRYH